MKYILISKLSVVALCALLANCYSPGSADPVGDTFTHTGNAIGNVVNSVVPQAPTTSQQRYPDPVNGSLVR